MCLFLAKYTPTSLLQQKYTLIRQLPEKHHKSQPSLQKSKIPTLEAFMWHLRNVDFQIPFTELQGVNVSILEYRIYIHTVVFSQIYPLGIFLSLCLCPCLCLYPPYFSVSLYLSVFQFAFVCLSLLCVCVHVCACVCVCVPHFVTKSFLFMFTLTIRVEFVATAHDQKDCI